MISVIIPNYNREGTILRAINSVFNQTKADFEIIIVDDCSQDNSLKLISEIQDNRIKIFKLDQNSGAAAARNYGIKMSKGEYISLLDSDDHYEPEFLEESIDSLSNTDNSVGFSWTGVRYIENNKIEEKIWQPGRLETPYLTLLHSLHIGTNSGITFKREVFEKCGYFDANLPAAEDTDFFLRISQTYDYLVIPKVLINIERDSSDRLSKNFHKIAQAYNVFLPVHFPIIDNESGLKRKYYYKLMWLNYQLNDPQLARTYYKKIPGELVGVKIKAVKYLYELLPLNWASYIHQKLSA